MKENCKDKQKVVQVFQNILLITNYAAKHEQIPFIDIYSEYTVVNRSHNRTRGDILAQMLTLLEKPQLKTAVMYDCRLSHAQLKRYFRILVEKGLAREEEGKWIISEKGKVYLSAYKTAAKMIEE